MSHYLSGRCLCGACQFDYTGEISFTLQCYCRDCQHVTGAGHAPQMMVRRDALMTKGPTKTYRQRADSGSMLEFIFCRDCGSPLLKATSRMPDAIAIYAGALDDPALFERGKDVFEAGRQPWDLS